MDAFSKQPIPLFFVAVSLWLLAMAHPLAAAQDNMGEALRPALVSAELLEAKIAEAEAADLPDEARTALVELYRRGQLFVMPNIVVPGDMEGFGIVMLEAGACGLPTLAADLEGIRDVVEEGVNGWFVPTGDADAFVARIESLLDDPEALRAASQRTAEYVANTFPWNRTAERYLEALRRHRR